MDVEAAGAATQGDRGFASADRGVGTVPIWDEDTLDPKVVHEYLTALARDDAARDHLRGQRLLKGLLSRVWVPGDAIR